MSNYFFDAGRVQSKMFTTNGGLCSVQTRKTFAFNYRTKKLREKMLRKYRFDYSLIEGCGAKKEVMFDQNLMKNHEVSFRLQSKLEDYRDFIRSGNEAQEKAAFIT